MTQDKYILAIDQGTTGTNVCVLNKQAKMVAISDHEHPQIYPQPGWVEHDPEAIWKTVTDGIAEALKKGGIHGEQIAAIGITNQRETVVAWDSQTGRPIYNAIVWQCRRTTAFTEKLKKQKATATKIKKKTGLVIDPYFSGSKIKWFLENVKEAAALAKQGRLKVGTIDTFLIYRLTGGASHKTDVSNASRTQLMDIHKGKWDKDLLKIFKVPQEILPEICASNADFGVTKGIQGIPDGTPITGVAGDQQAALFGQSCFEVGSSKCTFGTGSFLLMNTGPKAIASKSGLLTTIAWKLKGDKKITYALEGGAFICGAAVQFLRDQLEFISESSEVEKLASQVTSSEGVYLIPAFVGLGAPYWAPEARGAILGMTRGTTRAHLARATLEAMAFQNVDILKAMEKDLGRKLVLVRVDGGAVANNMLMQMQADFLGVTVQRPAQIESTALGAAFLAGLGVGYWSGLAEIKKIWALDHEFKPYLSAEERKKELAGWHSAVQRTL